MFFAKHLLIALVLVFLTGCKTTPEYIRGSVNAQVFSNPPDPRTFTVIIPENPQPSDRIMASQISDQLTAKGYETESAENIPNTAVVFSLEIGEGEIQVSNGSSSTEYPRLFQLSIYDLEEQLSTGNPTLVWQGEVSSKGSDTDKTELTEIFLEELFKYFEGNVQAEQFSKIRDW